MTQLEVKREAEERVAERRGAYDELAAKLQRLKAHAGSEAEICFDDEEAAADAAADAGDAAAAEAAAADAAEAAAAAAKRARENGEEHETKPPRSPPPEPPPAVLEERQRNVTMRMDEAEKRSHRAREKCEAVEQLLVETVAGLHHLSAMIDPSSLAGSSTSARGGGLTVSSGAGCGGGVAGSRAPAAAAEVGSSSRVIEHSEAMALAETVVAAMTKLHSGRRPRRASTVGALRSGMLDELDGGFQQLHARPQLPRGATAARGGQSPRASPRGPSSLLSTDPNGGGDDDDDDSSVGADDDLFQRRDFKSREFTFIRKANADADSSSHGLATGSSGGGGSFRSNAPAAAAPKHRAAPAPVPRPMSARGPTARPQAPRSTAAQDRS